MSFRVPAQAPAAAALPRVPPDDGAAVAVARPLAARPDAESDDALILRIAAGDQLAFRTFAHRHVVKSLAIAQRIIGNSSDAEEVVQDALLRIWQHAGDWQSGSARVTSWLYRIVVNLAIDRLRQRREFVSIDDAGDPTDPAPSAEMHVEGRQLETFIASAIAELPARQRAALTLCYFQAMECSEAALVMGISVSAMEALLVRGRRTLRARLDTHATDGVKPAARWTVARTAIAPASDPLFDLPIGPLAASPA
jgi:RNA polymerase sigma-70 factor (ECF subfamily)